MKNIDIINKIIKTLSNRNGFDNWWDDIDDDIKDDIKNDLVSILDDALLDKPENIVFNDDEISEFQKMETFHPLTCCGPSDIPECKRNKKEGDTYEEIEVYKDPITSKGSKTSKKGQLYTVFNPDTGYKTINKKELEQHKHSINMLQVIFEMGVAYNIQTKDDIDNILSKEVAFINALTEPVN